MEQLSLFDKEIEYPIKKDVCNMTTNITGNVYDTILSLAPGEKVTINDLEIKNNEEIFVKLHLNHKRNYKRKAEYSRVTDIINGKELTPQGMAFEQQWER